MSLDALSFEGVWKSHPQVDGQELHALRDVTARVEPGAKVAIIGRSGSGKSTFLHLAAGIDEPSRGEISILGSRLSELSDQERTLQRREKIGLVFQFFHLLPHLDVLDNVVLPALIAGDQRSIYEPRSRELLERVGLGDRTGETVEKLSGGEMQRVAICRAMLRRPSLLLADEPTGNLDDENGRRVMELLLHLVDDEASTLIYVTHSRELAAMADQTWSLHSGILEKT
jgi:ABC-type lipoprotein export system ATPase subunit